MIPAGSGFSQAVDQIVMARADILALLETGDWLQLAALAQDEAGASACLLLALAAPHALPLPRVSLICPMWRDICKIRLASILCRR